MKKKIIGILICMLMILTAFSAVATRITQEKSSLVQSTVIPNDPGISKQYYLQTTHLFYWGEILLGGKILIKIPFFVKPDNDIDAPEAWAIETGSPDVVIALLDSGVDYTHPDLAANIWNNIDEIPNNGIDDDLNGYIDDVKGWDFWNNDSDPKDDYGGGTILAGIVGAVGNNSIGIAGVCWNCKIMPVKIVNETGWSDWEYIAAGIKYAADNGADVICTEIGDYCAPKLVEDAVNYAYGKGVFLCATAGLNNTASEVYPAAYQNVTAVGLLNFRNKPHIKSNYGDWVDIASIAFAMYSTTPTYPFYWHKISMNLNYSNCGGSSAALVAGVAALLLSKNPSLTPAEVKDLLCNNTDPYSGIKYIGVGRVNAGKALAALTNES